MAHFSTSGMFFSIDSPLETGSVVEYGKNWQSEMHTEKSFGKQDAKELKEGKKNKQNNSNNNNKYQSRLQESVRESVDIS